MTRLLATGDWHAGSGPEYGRTPADRLADQAAAYQAIATIARDELVDAVLFAGDLTHRNLPTPGALGAAKDAFDQILGNETTVIAISGNSHDVAHVDERIGLELVKGDRFYLARRPEIIDICPSCDLEGWPDMPAVACLPWAPDTRLMASGDSDRSDVRALMAEHLIATAARMRSDIGDRPAILMLHYSIAGGVSASGAQAELFGETVLPLADLQAQQWTAIVAGHLHRYQVLSTDPLVLYPGPPAIVDFGEASYPHGCVLLDINDQTGAVEHRFVEIPGRPFVTVDLDLDGIEDGPLDGFWPGPPDFAEGAVVRVRYKATPEQARRVDHQAITKALYDAGAHKVFAIQPTIERADRGRLDEVMQAIGSSFAASSEEGKQEPRDASSLTPLEAVEIYIVANQLDEQAAAALRERTGAYLEGRTPTAAEPQEAAA